MKEVKVQRIISIICSIVGLIISLYGLLAGLESIGSTGFGGLGVIYILPSIIALIIIILDLLITVDKIKKGLVYSCISSLIKIVTIICFIPSCHLHAALDNNTSITDLFNIIKNMRIDNDCLARIF